MNAMGSEGQMQGVHPLHIHQSYDALHQKVSQQAWTLGILAIILFVVILIMMSQYKKWFHRFCDKPKNTTTTTDTRRSPPPDRPGYGPYYRKDRPMRGAGGGDGGYYGPVRAADYDMKKGGKKKAMMDGEYDYDSDDE